MYTGIIQEIGEISRVEKEQNGWTLDITMETDEIESGDSFAVNGVCLTVVAVSPGTTTVEMSGETVKRTYLNSLSAGDRVNIERPLSVGSSLNGHIVKGTVDTTTRIVNIDARSEDWLFTFSVPEGMEQYVVEKGAVALDGTSLTVAGVDRADQTFSVALVPETYERTVFAEKAVGDPAHFEADILAKYVQQGQELGADLEVGI